MEVSFSERSCDDLKCVSNPLNTNSNDSHFDWYEMLITRQQIYSINNNIVERLNNSLIIDKYMNKI